MNLAGSRNLARTPENRVWYRAIHPQYWTTALQVKHTSRIPSRFGPGTAKKPAFPILYLAEDHNVALFEVGALLGSPFPGKNYVPNPRQAWTILNVQVNLQSVADLTLIAEQKKIATNAQELTGDWEANSQRNAHSSVSQPTGLAPTQLLGRALYQVRGIEGFRAISARQPTHLILVVFPDKLDAGSSIVFRDQATAKTFTIP